jgi:hypothetical protein
LLLSFLKDVRRGGEIFNGQAEGFQDGKRQGPEDRDQTSDVGDQKTDDRRQSAGRKITFRVLGFKLRKQSEKLAEIKKVNLRIFACGSV